MQLSRLQIERSIIETLIENGKLKIENSIAAAMAVSNPFCSPRFRASVSGSPQQTAFAFGVPDHINGFHPYLVGSVCL